MKILGGYGSVKDKSLLEIERIIGINLSNNYIQIIKDNDGGVPEKDVFEYYDIDYQFIVSNCVGAFLCINPNQYGDLLSTYLDPPEFFPAGLVAIAKDGGGNLICFDYRKGKDNPNPPIVFWNHGADIGKDVSFVAKDFETFIGMLRSEDELEN